MANPAVFFAETGGLDYAQLLARWHDALSKAEVERLRSLRFVRDRRDYLSAHVLQRLAARSATGRSSLTHCEGFVACTYSMADEGAIGVDAERISAEERLKGMRTVVRAVGDAPGIGLVELWTVKEAYLKSTGEGFTGEDGFAVLGALECSPVRKLDGWDMIAIRDARTGNRAVAWTRRLGGHVISVVEGNANEVPPSLTRLEVK